MPQVDDSVQTVADSAFALGPDKLISLLEGERLEADASVAAALAHTDGGPRTTSLPELVNAAPGRAGIHFETAARAGQGGTDEPSPRVDPAFLAEVACASGVPYAREVAHVHFPSSGITLLPAQGTRQKSLIEAGPEGVRVTMRGAGTVHLGVGAEGRLLLADDTSVPSGVEARITDELVDGLRFVTHGTAIAAVAGTDVTPLSARLSPSELACVHEAVRVLDRTAPEFLEQLRSPGFSIVPLAGRPGVARQSLSHRQLPGVVFASVTSPGEFIDLVCHEFHHLRLFTLDAAFPLLANPSAGVLSPWRSQRRTAEGLLHAIYVFAQLSALFGRIFDTYPAAEAGNQRVATWLVCMSVGLELLRECDGQLTEHGDAVVSRMEADTSESLRGIEKLVGASVIARLRTEVAAHLAQAGNADSRAPRYLF
ncbi:HEXXH motif-containing putative peptide modification protein [Streptomyces sp. NPDC051976]|uniref:aKG-HExxH-type peptide beta-hydroxylase n=1 Tax=Streptomyces sp. NPDC051976 TaxID=3154947 RepID=UPI00342CBA66